MQKKLIKLKTLKKNINLKLLIIWVLEQQIMVKNKQIKKLNLHQVISKINNPDPNYLKKSKSNNQNQIMKDKNTRKKEKLKNKYRKKDQIDKSRNICKETGQDKNNWIERGKTHLVAKSNLKDKKNKKGMRKIMKDKDKDMQTRKMFKKNQMDTRDRIKIEIETDKKKGKDKEMMINKKKEKGKGKGKELDNGKSNDKKIKTKKNNHVTSTKDPIMITMRKKKMMDLSCMTRRMRPIGWSNCIK